MKRTTLVVAVAVTCSVFGFFFLGRTITQPSLGSIPAAAPGSEFLVAVEGPDSLSDSRETAEAPQPRENVSPTTEAVDSTAQQKSHVQHQPPPLDRSFEDMSIDELREESEKLWQAMRAKSDPELTARFNNGLTAYQGNRGTKVVVGGDEDPMLLVRINTTDQGIFKTTLPFNAYPEVYAIKTAAMQVDQLLQKKKQLELEKDKDKDKAQQPK